MHFVYILYSVKLNRFYTGYTSNFDNRMEFHRNAESHKFTANAEDWELYLKIECENKSQALSIEKHIKNMKSKTYIENLIKYPEIIDKLLIKYKSDC
ncbi:GIY-YIG nuclease family protein [Flavobacterium sp. LPB0248]|uniref:GIY-YIG nuclease family protein n=1 Tax=Flavobacterium sp. LPB0248 TaxID=2614441 RepID=UPI0015A70920|nr:GIY-YIG nuclease family protein [Flavobacterium sp. LPB0248]QLC66707.1 GIY-YIG nuclease family protein [Flavobacterium sp. LPB0248]